MINIYLYPDTNARHVDEIIAGLWELQHNRKLSLKYVFRNPIGADNDNFPSHRATLCALITDKSKKLERKICFDVMDGPWFDMGRLKRSDYYFKRSFELESINKLDPSLRSKILPYGMNYRVSSRHERKIGKRNLIYHLSSGRRKNNIVQSIKAIAKGYVKQLLFTIFPASKMHKVPLISEFECGPEVEVKPLILFQVKVYDPQQLSGRDPKEFKGLMDNRADIVRVLREKFQEKFVGGVLPSPYALEYYPDCISILPHDRRNYLSLVKKCLIAVMTTGLHDSIGGKLPEYLASSRCVVSEPLRHELPNALRENEHYVQFNSPDECVQACLKILNNRYFAENMREANFDYYEREVKPPQKIWSCITKCLVS